MAVVCLFCSDPLRPARCDPAFAGEARAARAAGLAVALIDHDALVTGDLQAAVARVPRGVGRAWYRGWMVPSERYAGLERALAARGVVLLTSAAGYHAAHELPSWYGTFAALTPSSGWLPVRPGQVPDRAALTEVAARLGAGPGVVKDWVKSRKHEWAEAAFVPELTDTERLAQVVSRFVELQGDFLTGGVVLRSFEDYLPVGEARVWWVDGEPVEVGAHPDSAGSRPVPELTGVSGAVRALGCRFVTTDLALRADGVWRVVEVGDGQVSGLPAGADPARLFGALALAGGG